MKKLIILLTLTVAMLFSTTGCQSTGDGGASGESKVETFEDKMDGLSSALTAMSNETSVKAKARVWFDFGGAETVTYEKLLELIPSMALTGTPPSDFENYKFDISMECKQDDSNNLQLSLSLPTAGGDYKQFVEVLFIDGDIYVSTDIVEEFVNIVMSMTLPDGNEGISDQLSNYFSNIDYLQINSEYLSELGMPVDLTDFETQIENSSKHTAIFNDAIKNNIGKIITEDLNAISVKDGAYVLSFDKNQTKTVLKSLSEVLSDNSDAIVDFFAEISDNSEINKETFNTFIEGLKGVSESEEWEHIDVNTTLSVKGNENESEIKFEINASDSSLEETIKFGMETFSEKFTDKINEPAADKFVDFEEFNTQLTDIMLAA